MNIWRSSTCLLLGLLLASCATKDPSSIAYGKRDVGIDDAFVLPGERSVVGITQERASNAITQTIALSTNSNHSGENHFRVTMFGPVDPTGASENTLSRLPLTDGRISRELRTEMAGIAMNRSPYYVQNNYGPFSYATGKTSSGDSCIYAWQQIRSPEHTQNFFQNRGRIDLRLRLCETGASQEQLLASMYDYTINSTIAATGWNPYGEPAGPSPDLGVPGNPVLAPAVSSNTSGPISGTRLNSDRLNTAFSETEAMARSRATNARAAPAVRQSAPRVVQTQAAREPYYYPAAPQPQMQQPASSLYPQAPIVPAPNQIQGQIQGQIQVTAPQPGNVAPTHSAAPLVQVPSPSLSSMPVTNAQIAPAAPAIVVPSPCRLSPSQASGTHAGNIPAVCP